MQKTSHFIFSSHKILSQVNPNTINNRWIMHPPNSSDYQMFTSPQSPPPAAPAPPVMPYGDGGTATGIPVNSTNDQYNNDNNINRPPIHVPFRIIPKIRGPWSTGLCDCFTDVNNCKFQYFHFLSFSKYVHNFTRMFRWFLLTYNRRQQRSIVSKI